LNEGIGDTFVSGLEQAGKKVSFPVRGYPMDNEWAVATPAGNEEWSDASHRGNDKER
jgi:hypothetical protein